MIVLKGQLDLVSLPKETKTYKPVSHIDLVTMIINNANKCSNTPIISERYELAREGKQMFGYIQYKIGISDTNLSIGFRNSYDKSLPIGIVSGACVTVCSNLIFKGDILTIRKHTINILKDIEDIIQKSLILAKTTYESILEDKIKFVNISLNDRRASELLGILFAEKEILNSTQLSIAKEEWFKENINFPENSMWKFYNCCTEGLKHAHPTEIMEKHTQLHEFLINLN